LFRVGVTADGGRLRTEQGSQATEQSKQSAGPSLTAGQRLKLLVAERRQLNHELLLMNPALEAS